MGLILLTLAVQTAFRIFVPVGFQLVFDRAIVMKDMKYLLSLLAVYFVFWLVQSLSSILQDYLSARTGVAAINDLRMIMFRHLSRLPQGYLSHVSTGDIMSRFSVDLAAIENAMVQSFNTFVFSGLNLVFSTILLLHWEWRLALFTLTGMSIGMLGPRLLAKNAKKAGVARKECEGRMSSAIQENIVTHEVLRSFNLWSVRQAAFRDLMGLFRREAIRAYLSGALVSRAGSQGAFLVQILVMLTGGYFVISGALTMGTLVGFLVLLQNMVAAVSHLSASAPNLIQASAGMHRVNEFLAAETLPLRNGADRHLPRLSRSIRFEKVSFHYNAGEPVLRNLSFHVTAGQSIAVVGPSGAGKSSILKLLLRLYDPVAGMVTLDGVDVKEGSESSFRGQTSVVAQESLLFDTSLRENIRMGCLEAGDEEVIEAAKSAEIHEWIMEQPNGYDTPVGELGRNLSGGQRQRIAIARALLRNPALLVLDEATSALDPVTEKAICHTLERVARKRTLFSATHRLNTIANFDWILVMKDGGLVEQGRHRKLLDMNGLYRELWEKQKGFMISEDGYRAECSPERLKLIPLLSSFDPGSLKAIASLMVSEFHPGNRILFEKGDYGDKFYIVVQGSVEVVLPGKQSGFHQNPCLESGDFFGEMALLYDKPRNATVRTQAPTLVLTLTKYQFRNLLKGEEALTRLIAKTAQRRKTASLL